MTQKTHLGEALGFAERRLAAISVALSILLLQCLRLY